MNLLSCSEINPGSRKDKKEWKLIQFEGRKKHIFGADGGRINNLITFRRRKLANLVIISGFPGFSHHRVMHHVSSRLDNLLPKENN